MTLKTSNSITFGQHFIVEPASTSLTQDEKNLLKELKPSGIMLRTKNFLSNEPYSIWLAAYKELLSDIEISLGDKKFIVSVDHEGEKIVRFPPPITRFPYAGKLKGDLNAIKEVANATALELQSLGINILFGPVADINSNPNNPVIGERSFGATASIVSESAKVFATAITNSQILTCAKHFPGHGDTASDSHYEVPVVTASDTELHQRELVPFKELITWGIPLLMTGHVLVPSIDDKEHATLSPKINLDLLRNKLGFKGALVSDALSMAPILKELQSPDFPKRFINSGLDFYLYAGPQCTIEGAYLLAERLEACSLSDEEKNRLKESSSRIKSVISKLTMHEVKELDLNVLNSHQQLAVRLLKVSISQNFIPDNFS